MNEKNRLKTTKGRLNACGKYSNKLELILLTMQDNHWELQWRVCISVSI